MKKDCYTLYKDYHNLRFHTCPASIDECVFAVAMPMNEMKSIDEPARLLGFLPCLKELQANILRDELRFTTLWGTETDAGIFLHFGTIQTHQPLYKRETWSLQFLCEGRNNRFSEKVLETDIVFCIEKIKYSLGFIVKRIRDKLWK